MQWTALELLHLVHCMIILCDFFLQAQENSCCFVLATGHWTCISGNLRWPTLEGSNVRDSPRLSKDHEWCTNVHICLQIAKIPKKCQLSCAPEQFSILLCLYLPWKHIIMPPSKLGAAGNRADIWVVKRETLNRRSQPCQGAWFLVTSWLQNEIVEMAKGASQHRQSWNPLPSN